jgi:hypothetical protein
MTLRFASAAGEVDIPLANDGSFSVRVAHGEYKFSIRNVPQGYTAIPGTIHIDAPGTEELTVGLRGNP